MMTNSEKECIITNGHPKLGCCSRSLTNSNHKSSQNLPGIKLNPMRRNFFQENGIGGLLLVVGISLFNIAADSTVQAERASTEASGGGWWYPMVVIIGIAAFGVAFFLWRKSKNSSGQPQFNYEARYRNNYNNESYDMEGVDAEKELEWLRKAKKASAKPGKGTHGPKTAVPAAKASFTVKSDKPNDPNFDTKTFQDKMRKLQYAQMPINSFDKLSPAKRYEPLPLSDDQSLVNAIEQANEEFEEDEMVRDLAVRILAAFRMRNSVESLSQIALYDLSSNLRSKAVSILTDFDHESVFEAILLACADPTREVRAAAARGLFRLNFDRADAWKRIIETNDEFRMSHAARAATEAGIVIKSFDRLVHEDLKVAYEAFALVTLLIRSGETHELFEAIKNHKDERVRFALLHVLKVQRDERTLDTLHSMQKDASFPTDVAERIRDVINSFETVIA